jgi:hypothetical protein
MTGAGDRGRRQFMTALAAGAAGRPAVGARPTRPARQHLFDVTTFGAVGDGRTPATGAIQAAIDACGQAGGGLVLVPAGQYLTGALFLRNKIELHVAAGATLLASQRFEDFPPIQGRWEGIERTTYSSLLTGEDLEDVVLSGAGLLDGQGPPWWEAFGTTRKLRLDRGLPREAPDPPEAPLKWPCPRIVNLIRCQRVAIRGLRFENAPSWSLHLLYCQDVVVEDLNMIGLHAQLASGLVVDSCKRIRISNCAIGSGADCIGLKAGYNEDGRRVGLPCEDIIISGCQFFDSNSAGVAIGSETAAWIRNVTISNCTMTNTRTMFHFRSTRGRGGGIERVRVVGCVGDRLAQAAIVLLPFFDSVRWETYMTGLPMLKSNPETNRQAAVPASEGTPTFRDISFSGLTVGAAPDLATIEGLPERFIHKISLTDITAGSMVGGVSCVNAQDVFIGGLSLQIRARPAVAAAHVQHLEVAGLRAEQAQAATPPPVVYLDNVSDAFIHGCNVPAGAELVHAAGQSNRDVTVTGNKGGK